MSGNLSTTLIISSVVLVIGITFVMVFLPMLFKPESKLFVGDGVFRTEVALNNISREIGLSGRSEIGDDQALLMVFPNESKWGIWMKNMNFPIDVVWLNKEKKVISVVKNFSPDDAITRYPTSPALYVIEFPAGTTDEKSIEVGKTALFQVSGRVMN